MHPLSPLNPVEILVEKKNSLFSVLNFLISTVSSGEIEFKTTAYSKRGTDIQHTLKRNSPSLSTLQHHHFEYLVEGQ